MDFIDTFTVILNTGATQSLPYDKNITLPFINQRQKIKKLHLTSLAVCWNDIGTSFIDNSCIYVKCRELCDNSDATIISFTPFNLTPLFIDQNFQINLKCDIWFNNIKMINNEINIELDYTAGIVDFQGSVSLTFEAYG